jgi:hypothetical protein
MSLNRIRHTPLKTSAHGAVITTKLRDHGLLAFLNNEETGAQPNQNSDTCNDTNAYPSGFGTWWLHAAATALPATTLATEQAAEFAVEITPELVQIWWTAGPPLRRLGALWWFGRFLAVF